MNIVRNIILALIIASVYAPAFSAEQETVPPVEKSKDLSVKASPVKPLAKGNLPPPTDPAVMAKLDSFLKRMQADPKDLDAFYAYAQLASQHGFLRQAANAYNHMLRQKPDLHRIKLSLALLYIRMQMLVEAKALLLEVDKTNPPEKVKENIKTTLATIESYLKDKTRYPPLRPEDKPVAPESQQAKAPEQKADAPQQPPKPPSKKEMKARLKELKALMEKDPENLDPKFEYAQIAANLNKLEEAIATYEEMLAKHPDLPRIKLELGMLYGRATMYQKAQDMFKQVLSSNPPPPEPVKKNVEGVMASLEKALKTDKLSGSVSVAYNNDTNATSAAASNQTTYADLSIPLAGSSTSQPDQQVVAMTSLTHTHTFHTNSPKWGLNLATTGLYYRSDQATEHNLDISLLSLKTGPTLSLPGFKSQFGLNASTSLTRLESHKYTHTKSGEFSWKFVPLGNLMLDASAGVEYRQFMNSPTVPTNIGRTGHAHQQTLGLTYGLTAKDIFSVTNTWRNENAQEDKYGLDQMSITGTYIRTLPWDLAFSAAFNLKESHYNDLDSSISSTKLRNDRERSMTYTLSKKLPKNITLSASYQYKNVTSNIQNYDYNNHRTSVTMAWGF